MFLRFIKMLVWIFAAFTVLTMAVIVPLNTVNVKTKDIHDDLDKISWIKYVYTSLSEVVTDPLHSITDSTQSDRYAGHIVMVYILTCEFTPTYPRTRAEAGSSWGMLVDAQGNAAFRARPP